ncbi:hypothetical protein BDZ45DRAFT_680013 [Acephala macrosclerotiorum]|nr:hypothetical protein BDZ45DRAFT_680013 [Acephala macrosclerotiorum]
MDEFAQSREDDDLFADEFEPVADSTAIIEEVKPAFATPQYEESAISNPPQASNHAPRYQGQERRGRGGRGRGRGQERTHNQNGLGASRYADPPPQPAPVSSHTPAPEAPPSQATTQSDNAPPPTEPANPIASTRTPAVRGDRSATGGPAHKKLTEEELTAKMAQMAILNEKKAERHRLSEADQAAFQHREKELAKERKEKAQAEKKNERLMEMERAKNRERKMKAQGGREWDSEKLETDIVDGRGRGRSSEYVRGGHGGVIRGRGAGGGLGDSRWSAAGDEVPVEEFESTRGRGRGRGGRGGRSGRGAKGSGSVVPTFEDFPSLPTAPKTSSGGEVKAATEAVKSPMETAHDWAEEMATPVEEKKDPGNGNWD